MVEGSAPNPSTTPTSSSGHPPQPTAREKLKRPHHLLDRPEAIQVIYATPEGMPRRFVWRRAVHDIARAEGPSGSHPNGGGNRRRRGCAIITASRQARPPLLDLPRGLAGDGRGGAPGWFLHGMFG